MLWRPTFLADVRHQSPRGTYTTQQPHMPTTFEELVVFSYHSARKQYIENILADIGVERRVSRLPESQDSKIWS
jgi:hypothetical protein